MIITIKIKDEKTTIKIKIGEKLINWNEFSFVTQMKVLKIIQHKHNELLKNINNE